MPSETLANGEDRIVHRLDLSEYGLDDVPNNLKQAAKTEVANYLVNETVRDISNGVSPVRGEGRFKRLEGDYAVREKGGNRLSNLEKDGDLLNDYRVTPVEGDFVEAGHVGGETPKADGHNQLSAKAKSWARQNNFPRRRYIPDDDQRYVPKIENEIRQIISEFVPTENTRNIEPQTTDPVTTPDSTSISIDDLFDDDVIESLVGNALADRGIL